MHPIPTTVSSNTIVAGLVGPEYIRIVFLQNIINLPLCAARATISSAPLGNTLVMSKEPDDPPDHWYPVERWLKKIVCLFPVTSAAHNLPKPDKISLACGAVPDSPLKPLKVVNAPDPLESV